MYIETEGLDNSTVRAKIMKYILLLSLLLLASCSTVERHTYYTPDNKFGSLEGPGKQDCGMVQFDGKPDAVIYKGIRYSANESYEPYLWGPWLITVVPVFPITWIADIFINPKLEITYSKVLDIGVLPEKSDININVASDEGKIKNIKPESVVIKGSYIAAVFPVEANEIDSFSVPVDNSGTIIKFSKTSRWAWTQICIN